jgi:hypothetical protein
MCKLNILRFCFSRRTSCRTPPPRRTQQSVGHVDGPVQLHPGDPPERRDHAEEFLFDVPLRRLQLGQLSLQRPDATLRASQFRL